VVGGGITGLAAAERLLNAGAKVTLFEARDEVGGFLRTVHKSGFIIDEGPDAMLAAKPEAIELCLRAGLANDLIPIAPLGARILSRGRLVRLPPGLSGLVPSRGSALRAEGVSLLGRMRAALEPFVPRATLQEDESIRSFMIRRYGREFFERAIEPLLSGIYAGDASRLSISATFPQLFRTPIRHSERSEESAFRSRYPAAFYSLRQGMAALPAALVRDLESRGLHMCTRSRVTTLERKSGAWEISADTVTERVDKVVIALPAPAAAALLQRPAPDVAAALASIEHVSMTTVSLGFRENEVPRPLDATGYVVPAIEKREVQACTWSSSKWQSRAPEGHALLRVFMGGSRFPGAIDLTDDELVSRACAEVETVLGIRAQPVVRHVARWETATPQYLVGHSSRVAAIRQARRENLSLAGNYLEGVGLSDWSAARAAEEVLGTDA
jgi:protoporphyrinogen/coproporphyrinogen III oxidase